MRRRASIVHFSYNPDWHLENGVSVLAARDGSPIAGFALLMGDHLFEAPVLDAAPGRTGGPRGIAARGRLAPRAARSRRRSDQGPHVSGSRIVAIGKDLRRYDALDTGMFVCSPRCSARSIASRAAGDTTLSGGIRELAAAG